ncbi:GNAT family N-acetyltransferase [Hymenobacter cellulosilyticus]|uniref:Arginyl-tRNA--protein transferase n=1 Tax=Hymenobacter cellulosilyticus TaxID=2932248 RepID=A0A8T9QEV5_9BACT|nr:GNAT family N-acetyltransferase [Hymenobacter cellulosilyticus]UOQ73363.1 arginyl-tRNA--protein transferase [Hymenobacter cellulosilyticus]
MSASSAHNLIIPGEALDFYLSQGYYRMHQDLFTCRFLPIEGGFYTVHWLRIALGEVQYGPEQRRLLRLGERFTVRRRPFQLTDELEELYAAYRGSISFDAPPTVESFLLAGATHNVFTTEVFEIRDGERLVAAGIFDCGARSLAGIMNFYHPEYRKFSLGKYLMLRKIEHARELHHRYYYPGYIAHGFPKFDYKLFPCPAATEVFDARRSRWEPFSWETVARQSADLLSDWQDDELSSFDEA